MVQITGPTEVRDLVAKAPATIAPGDADPVIINYGGPEDGAKALYRHIIAPTLRAQEIIAELSSR